MDANAIWHIPSTEDFSEAVGTATGQTGRSYEHPRRYHVIGEGDSLEEAVKNRGRRLHALLKLCQKINIVLNVGEKFCLRQQELPFMGPLFTDEGLKPDPSKVLAIA